MTTFMDASCQLPKKVAYGGSLGVLTADQLSSYIPKIRQAFLWDLSNEIPLRACPVGFIVSFLQWCKKLLYVIGCG